MKLIKINLKSNILICDYDIFDYFHNKSNKNMFFETRLSRYLAEFLSTLKEKIIILQTSLSFVLFSLFTGFLFGNLFGTFLDTLRLYFFSNSFVGFFILVLIEAINSLVYGISRFEYGNKKKKVSLQLYDEKSSTSLKSEIQRSNNKYFSKKFHKNKRLLLAKFYLITQNLLSLILQKKVFSCYQGATYIKRILNSFKIGLLFGFFVDSFKVGS